MHTTNGESATAATYTTQTHAFSCSNNQRNIVVHDDVEDYIYEEQRYSLKTQSRIKSAMPKVVASLSHLCVSNLIGLSGRMHPQQYSIEHITARHSYNQLDVYWESRALETTNDDPKTYTRISYICISKHKIIDRGWLFRNMPLESIFIYPNSNHRHIAFTTDKCATTHTHTHIQNPIRLWVHFVKSTTA